MLGNEERKFITIRRKRSEDKNRTKRRGNIMSRFGGVILAILISVIAAGALGADEGSASRSYSATLTPAHVHDDFIRCKVCYRAIAHIWHTGDKLRKHCFEEGTDPRCDFSNLHSFGIEEMVNGVCEDLPLTHQAIHESEFDLVLSANVDHPEFVSTAISKACREWLHEEHGAEQIALYMYANLDANKPTEVILHNLQHRYCNRACDPSFKRIRDHHDHDRKLRFQQEKEEKMARRQRERSEEDL